MSNLKSTDKVVTEELLKDFYDDKILPYLGGNIQSMNSLFSRGDLYSTDEKIIGCWIDGKPLYQKTYNIGNLPNATTKTTAHGISNIDKVISCQGWYDTHNQYSSQYFGNIPAPSTGTSDYTIVCYCDNTNIISRTGSNLSQYTVYITIQYTKTTDSANSVQYGNANDYDGTERIVGTWFGKPLYQKTVKFTTPSATGVQSYSFLPSIPFSEMDELVLVDGYTIRKDGWICQHGFSAGNEVDWFRFVWGKESKQIYFYLITRSDAYTINMPAVLTFQYTKTTD